MTATFANWTHPTTGAVRIYVNSLAGQRRAKIYLEQRPVDSFGSDFDIKIFAHNLNRSERDNLGNGVELAMQERAGFRVEKFAHALKLVA